MATKQQVLNAAIMGEVERVNQIVIGLGTVYGNLLARVAELEAGRVAQKALNADFIAKTTKDTTSVVTEPITQIKRSFIQKILGK